VREVVHTECSTPLDVGKFLTDWRDILPKDASNKQ